MLPKANYRELAFILAIGVLQPITEISLGTQIASYYNVLAVVIVLSYVVYRYVGGHVQLKDWGFRRDNFFASLPFYLFFTLLAGILLYVYGSIQGQASVPLTFWYLIGLYPVWGIAQQFVLQNFIAKNLTTLIPNIVIRALVVAAIFSLSHVPSVELAVLTFMAGFFFTILYHYKPNLILLGASHGVLGALAFYLVLGQDQWVILREYFS